MGNLGATEILLIFFAILLLFGAKRIPEIARGLGKGIREFKSATREISNELNIDEQPRIQAPRPPMQQTAPRTDYVQPVQPPDIPPQ
jgi:sec-independent protein translocase protein TatA